MKYIKPNHIPNIELITDAEYNKIILEEVTNGNSNPPWKRIEYLVISKTTYMGTDWIDERRAGNFNNQSLQ